MFDHVRIIFPVYTVPEKRKNDDYYKVKMTGDDGVVEGTRTMVLNI